MSFIANQRVNQITNHLAYHSQGVTNHVHAKSPDDVVICCAIRTPITRARKGLLKDLLPEDLLAVVLKAIITKTHIDPALVQDIQVGTVLAPGGGATIARMAALFAGFPNSTPISTVNRQCSSGLQAVASIAHAIQAGMIDIGIGAGVEHMTSQYGPNAMPSSTSETITSQNQEAADCLLPMGITSENVAKEYNVSRADQDEFSAESHQKADAAQKKGLFDQEIVPVYVNGQAVLLDDGIRGNTSASLLAQLKPAFTQDGSTTAGNASQVSDGASAVLLVRRRVATQLHLPILGKFVQFGVIGVPPKVMGIGPAYAIPLVLKKVNLTVEQVDLYEINEAFASQALMSVRQLNIPASKVNVKGGAIALGHPLGCTGARQIATLLPELKRRNLKIGVVSMCIGSGMGAAAVIVCE